MFWGKYWTILKKAMAKPYPSLPSLLVKVRPAINSTDPSGIYKELKVQCIILWEFESEE